MANYSVTGYMVKIPYTLNNHIRGESFMVANEADPPHRRGGVGL